MKMKIFGNIIRAVRGARNWFGGGVARALVVTAVVLLACTAWAKTYQQSAMTNGRKWWYYLDSSGMRSLSMRIVVQHTRRPYR